MSSQVFTSSRIPHHLINLKFKNIQRLHTYTWVLSLHRSVLGEASSKIIGGRRPLPEHSVMALLPDFTNLSTHISHDLTRFVSSHISNEFTDFRDPWLPNDFTNLRDFIRVHWLNKTEGSGLAFQAELAAQNMTCSCLDVFSWMPHVEGGDCLLAPVGGSPAQRQSTPSSWRPKQAVGRNTQKSSVPL